MANTTTTATNYNRIYHAAAGNTGSTSKEPSDLERQKAINANLQKQISENIRRQEELVRQMQERGQAPAPSAPVPSAPMPSTVSSAPGSGNVSDVRAMQGASQQTSNMHMQGNNMHIQGNGMNYIAGDPHGMNFYSGQNGHNRHDLGGVTQSGGGQYNPVNPFLGQQGNTGMESPLASLEQSAAVMSNSNQQLARLLAANPSHPQLSRLFAANPSLFASMQRQQQHQSMVQPYGVSSAPVGNFHPSMPPPNSNSLPGNSNSAPGSPSLTGNRGRNGDDSLLPDSPLSPGSFNW
jgi:hypothetical protein